MARIVKTRENCGRKKLLYEDNMMRDRNAYE